MTAACLARFCRVNPMFISFVRLSLYLCRCVPKYFGQDILNCYLHLELPLLKQVLVELKLNHFSVIESCRLVA